MEITDVRSYQAGKISGAVDYRSYLNGERYSEAFPRTANDSFIAGWMVGWDLAKRADDRKCHA
jgi:hypothetical protein